MLIESLSFKSNQLGFVQKWRPQKIFYEGQSLQTNNYTKKLLISYFFSLQINNRTY